MNFSYLHPTVFHSNSLIYILLILIFKPQSERNTLSKSCPEFPLVGDMGGTHSPPSSINVLCYLQNYQMLPSKLQNVWSHYSTKLIHFSRKLLLGLYCRQSKYSLLIYNIYILSISGVVFAVPFLCFFQKLQVLVVKEFRNNFCCIIHLFV